MIIKGNVKRILHEKDNGWCVMVLKCGSEEHKVAGVRLGSCVVDSIVEADGDFTYHDTFGKQFTAKSISPTFDFDRKSLCAILNKTKIKGLGPKTVDRIVNQFGDDIPDIIENEHGKLTSVKGVSREMADGIEAYWKENFGTRKIIMRFGKFDIGINNIKKIYERWGLKFLRMTSDMQTDPNSIPKNLKGSGYFFNFSIHNVLIV
jgi:exodeoxyribonuclease V alpha subunit